MPTKLVQLTGNSATQAWNFCQSVCPAGMMRAAPLSSTCARNPRQQVCEHKLTPAPPLIHSFIAGGDCSRERALGDRGALSIPPSSLAPCVRSTVAAHEEPNFSSVGEIASFLNTEVKFKTWILKQVCALDLVFHVLLVLCCLSQVGWAIRYGRQERISEFRTSGSHLQQLGRCRDNNALLFRPHSVSITEFGAVGDGIILNTHAFQNAIFYLRSFADKGGAQLFVPAGRWLTGSFNLTSHLTLNLDKDAVILGSQDSTHWPVIDPLPSYGRGRELPGGRHSSLINAYNVTDVVITGDNGTIDGQGAIWWHWFHNQTLNYTRPHLIEVMDSTDVVISNLTFLNSPFWNIHPVYCSNVHIHNVTILAPFDSPNTDGIDPDSSSDVCIEDCYISTGDDVIAIKSGWDEYGIAYGRPSSNIIVRRVIGETPTSAGLALGSEMSGGITDVHVESFQIYNSRTGIRLKTAPGRGGFVKDIFISQVTMKNVQTAFAFVGLYGDHPDDHFDPNALPVVDRISFKDIVGDNITVAGDIQGIEKAPFTGICLSDIAFNVTSESAWNCVNVKGFSESVFPQPCVELQHQFPDNLSVCPSHFSSSGKVL
eukprot:Gb_28001 [translate_table: standard]